ncbi:MAG: hypothetical protein QME94_08105, partial [Anaerolineae bacterium]|nr:hypothetical protein [Anaerolineae bacterium]
MRWPRRAARRAWGSLIEPLWFTLWPAAGAQVDEQSVALRHGLEEGGVLSLDVAERERVIAALRLLAPHAAAQIVAEADRICRHTFDLLGSGPVALGARIDWHRDFASGHRWPERSYYRRIRPAPYPGGYDIKVPWELSRGHHLVRLGQAYWLTGD